MIVGQTSTNEICRVWVLGTGNKKIWGPCSRHTEHTGDDKTAKMKNIAILNLCQQKNQKRCHNKWQIQLNFETNVVQFRWDTCLVKLSWPSVRSKGQHARFVNGQIARNDELPKISVVFLRKLPVLCKIVPQFIKDVQSRPGSVVAFASITVAFQSAAWQERILFFQPANGKEERSVRFGICLSEK